MLLKININIRITLIKHPIYTWRNTLFYIYTYHVKVLRLNSKNYLVSHLTNVTYYCKTSSHSSVFNITIFVIKLDDKLHKINTQRSNL